MSVGSRSSASRPLAFGTAAGEKTMRAARPQTLRQVRITCTSANRVCRLYKILWCRCSASAAVQLRKLVVHSTKSPAGAVQSAPWRELEVSSSRAPAKFPVVMPCPVGSRNFVPRWNRRREKEHEGCATSNSAAGEITCTPANRVCRLYKDSMVQVLCICRSPAE